MSTSIKSVLDGLPQIQSVSREDVEAPLPFLEIVRRFAEHPGTVALMSGGEHPAARFHILGLFPWLQLRSRKRDLTLTHDRGEEQLKADPLELLAQLLERNRLRPSPNGDAGPGSFELPLHAGLLGYFSYDLKDQIEKLPQTSLDDLGLPDLDWVAPSVLLVQQVSSGKTALLFPHYPGAVPVEERRARVLDVLSAGTHTPSSAQDFRVGPFRSGFRREEYMDAVESIRRYIAAGDAYQVNLAQRFEAAFEGSAFSLFSELYQQNPAPFFAYVNAGDHHIVSTSPERFLRQDGRHVETHPIKGTRPRGDTETSDTAMRRELEQSSKDDAELSMIVDLLRNDIGKVCQAGSVRVTAHKRVETYQNVHHLVSQVEGVLDEEQSSVDLVQATFPGGSITGCPKIRAMEIIDELEPVRRHIYTGSIGYLSFHDTMDLSIAIRTATIANGRLVFSVGGGIVYDSDPASEYEETLHKGQTLFRALKDQGLPRTPNPVAWCNGRFAPVDTLTVPILSEGFQYGSGLFETLRVECGRPLLLRQHIERLERSSRACFDQGLPQVGWSDVIGSLIEKNHLQNSVASVKIILAQGPTGSSPHERTVAVIAKEYRPRSAPGGLRLATYAQRRHSHLASHKSMNYLFYKLAGDWARKRGSDEALIVNADGTASESNTANIFGRRGDKMFFLTSEHVLPGTTEARVRSLFDEWGIAHGVCRLTPEELRKSDELYLCNSLIGVVPVQSLDEQAFRVESELAQRLTQALFATPLHSGAF